jgi:hypothetical protein
MDVTEVRDQYQRAIVELSNALKFIEADLEQLRQDVKKKEAAFAGHGDPSSGEIVFAFLDAATTWGNGMALLTDYGSDSLDGYVSDLKSRLSTMRHRLDEINELCRAERMRGQPISANQLSFA